MADIDFTRTGVSGEPTYENFSCDVWSENPPTPDRVPADVTFERQVYSSGRVTMPDGRRVEMWGFRDPLSSGADGDKPFPSPLIRVRQGQVVHTVMRSGKATHTIHHHGLDPSTFNDGVGHLSFEVSADYTYQWSPHSAGTYFYHCHKNTVLHFEMGMYGPLIVDPPEGRGTLFSGGPRYDVEAIWAIDDVDPTWRELGADAGLCGEDARLDRFRPRYFMISGVPAPRTLTDARAVVRARAGQAVLIRLINASYSVLRMTFGLDATVFGVDGRGLGRPQAPWSRPIPIPAGRVLEMSPAQRIDVIVRPTRAGTFPVRIAFHDWVTDAIQNNGLGIAETRIIVS